MVATCVVPGNGTYTSGLFTYTGIAYSAGIATTKVMSPESLYTRYGYDPYPGHETDCVVYNYTDSTYSGTGGVSTRERVFDAAPSSLSFTPIESSQWWYYLWDLSSHVGGWPCLETTTTNSTTGATPGVGGAPPTGGTTATTLTKVYYGCNGATKITTAGTGVLCPPVSVGLTYTCTDGKITDAGEKDPFPLIRTVGTNDLRVAITYSNGYGGTAATRFQVGQVINGWTISQVFTTDTSINMHVLYLSGSGSNFTYNQSISSATATAIVKAGKGITDKCVLVGLYEFRNKTIWYTKGTVENGYPWGEVIEPELSVSVVNGYVTGVTVITGGSGFDKLNNRPPIGIDPPNTGGDFAKLEGQWVGGSLLSVKVVYPGSGYLDASPPAAFVSSTNQTRIDIASEKRDAKEIHKEFLNAYDATPNARNYYGYSKEEFLERLEPGYEEVKIEYGIPPITLEEDPIAIKTRKVGRTGLRKDLAEKIKPQYIDPSVSKTLTDTVPKLGKIYTDQVVPGSNSANDSYYQAISDDESKTVSVRARKVYSTVGSWFDLPCATSTTKYNMIDYSPDSRETASITVTMVVDVTNDTCSTCIGSTNQTITVSLTSGSNAANQTLTFSNGTIATVVSVNGGGQLTVAANGPINIFSTFTGTSPACTGSVTGVGSTGYTGGTSYTTVVKTYSGTGCLDYTISGTMGIHHNFSNESALWSQTVNAYGNPFPSICNQ